MRKVIFYINLSIDGCCDHMKLIGDKETTEYFVNLFREIDLFVFGRKTYELMVPYWPNVAKNEPENTFAQAFAGVKNIAVFSNSLGRVESENTAILRGNPAEEIVKLKQRPGKSISISGLTLLSQLVDTRLIDEYRFLIQPIIVGDGRRLLDGVSLPEKLRLKLIETTVFKSGSVALRYVKE